MQPVDRLLAEYAPECDGRVVVVDAPGLVQVARERYDVVVWCDDIRDAEPGQDLSVDMSDATLVLAHLPKSLDALAEQSSLAAASGATYLGAGLDKHLNRSMNDVLERSYNDVHATRGLGKCRGLVGENPKPDVTPHGPKTTYNKELRLTLVAHGRTFAGTRIDAGTRLLLDTRREWPAGRAIDVGCGNGVLTAMLASSGEDPVLGIDVSADAVLSTRATLAANNLTADVLWADGLRAIPSASADLIVTNPPFHVGHAKDSTPTLDIINDAWRVLARGGEFWVVFNAHLPYLQAMGATFGWADVIERDRDYIVARAIRK